MNLSQRLSNIFLLLYRNINRTGVLNREWVQSAFNSSYFAYKKYLEDSTAKLAKNHPELFHNGHILDIGANIGYTSYVFSKVLTPGHKIFAFEPEKRNINLLKKAADLYCFSNKLILTAAAVGDKNGEIEIWRNDGHHADHRVITEEFRKQFKGSIQSQKTSLVSIDHFLKTQTANQPIAFIKIDVQGYELAVCKGMQETLMAYPNCVVEFEYCPSIMTTLGYHGEELLGFFKERNYFFYQVGKKGDLIPVDIEMHEKIRQGKSFSGYFDIVCAQRNLLG